MFAVCKQKTKMEMARPYARNGKIKAPLYRLDLASSKEKKDGQVTGYVETHNKGKTTAEKT